jgi:Cu2+-exporting ATPase
MKFSVKGMSCAACSVRVENAVKTLKGVESCTVNLLTNSMNVEGNFEKDDVINAVNKAGYFAEEYVLNSSSKGASVKNNVFKLIASCLLSVILMYFSMGSHMLGIPEPLTLSDKPLINGLIQLIISLIVIVINFKFFKNGFKGVFKGMLNMDTLVSIGSGASFIYSVFLLSKAFVTKQSIGGLYFDSAAMILALISVGKTLEAYSKGKTTNAINALIELKPQTVTVVYDGIEKIISVKDIKVDDIFIVKNGESFSVDGVIIEGSCTVDESMLTGESIPVDKKIGDKVFSATVNKSGYVKCKATGVGEETVLSRIINTVLEASQSKAPIAKLADKVAGVFVPIVIGISIITAIVWFFAGSDAFFIFEKAISVLVISCPCALGLATPVAIMVGSGVGARNGILFKNASSIECAGRIKSVVFDKTGTITNGNPSVTDVISANEELIKYAYSIEKLSEHPLAKAIVEYAKELEVAFFDATDFTSYTGSGVSSNVNGSIVRGGNLEFIKCNVDERYIEIAQKLAQEGKTPLFFEKENVFLGIIAVADTVKEDSALAVKRLRRMGIDVFMLTGDNEITAQSIAKKVGISSFKAKAMPEDKVKYLNELKKKGKVAMVGDGVNDAPALTSADLGIAIGTGTDIAIDSADIVLMKGSLNEAVNAIILGRKVLTNIKENLFWAFFYNSIGIPLAAGVFYHILGWQMNPMFGAAAMSASSICVVLNALRLNFINFKDKKEKKMKKVVKIGGMMCGHCEARVKKLLEGFEQVDEAIVSHKKGTAILSLNSELSDEDIKKAIEADGYTFE